MRFDSKRKRILAICCGAHAVQDGLSASLYVLLPVLKDAFGLTFLQIGVLRATGATAMALFELPSGMLSEWLGERRLLVFGLVCAGVGFVFLATVSGLWAILACLFVAGTGGAFQHALSSSVISHSFDVGQRRSALGLYNSSGDAGKFAFTGMFSLALGAGMAWQSVVTGFGLMALVFAAILLFSFRRLDIGGAQDRDSEDSAGAEPIGWGISDRTGFLALNVVVLLDTAAQAGFLTFIALLIASRGVETELAAMAVVLTLVGGMFGKAGCGFLAERLGARYSFMVVQCATAVGIAALLAAPTYLGFVLLPVLGIFLQGSTSITYGSVGDYVHGQRQSRGFALIYSISGLSAIAAPILFGWLADDFGLPIAMAAMAVVSLLAIPPGVYLRTLWSPQGAS